jgi:hypothetical protein
MNNSISYDIKNAIKIRELFEKARTKTLKHNVKGEMKVGCPHEIIEATKTPLKDEAWTIYRRRILHDKSYHDYSQYKRYIDFRQRIPVSNIMLQRTKNSHEKAGGYH